MDQGFRGIGVNVVARRAGVSKELIYRYFGSMENLIRQLMDNEDYWSMQSSNKIVTKNSKEFNKNLEIKNMIFKQIDDLRKNKELQEIRRWELIDLNNLTIELAKRREISSKKFLKNNQIKEGSVEAGKLAILLSGILYLVLRSKTSSEWFGINLEDENGWNVLRSSLKSIIDEAFIKKDNFEFKDEMRDQI